MKKETSVHGWTLLKFQILGKLVHTYCIHDLLEVMTWRTGNIFCRTHLSDTTIDVFWSIFPGRSATKIFWFFLNAFADFQIYSMMQSNPGRLANDCALRKLANIHCSWTVSGKSIGKFGSSSGSALSFSVNITTLIIGWSGECWSDDLMMLNFQC